MAPLPKVGGMGGGNTQQSGTAVNGADYRCRWVRQGCSPGLSPFTSFPGGGGGSRYLPRLRTSQPPLHPTLPPPDERGSGEIEPISPTLRIETKNPMKVGVR
jgi:hypothetical protein